MLVLDDPRFSELVRTRQPRRSADRRHGCKLGGETVRVSGQIDRLAVTQGSVLIGDFKTNRPPPRRIADVPPSYVRQLALYRAVLGKLYPDQARARRPDLDGSP